MLSRILAVNLARSGPSPSADRGSGATDPGAAGDGGAGEAPVAQDIVEARLLDALAGSDCPICVIRRRVATRYFDGILWESVNDPGVRAELSVARGYCPTHASEVLAADTRQAGGGAGAATLYASIVGSRIPELREVASAADRSVARATAAAARPARCPCCAVVQGAVSGAVAHIVEHLSMPAWKARVAASSPCLDDLLVLGTATSARPGARAAWSDVAAVQVERLERLRDDLLAFSHNSSHDRRHRITGSQQAAPRLAARFLGGDMVDRDGDR